MIGRTTNLVSSLGVFLPLASASVIWTSESSFALTVRFNEQASALEAIVAMRRAAPRRAAPRRAPLCKIIVPISKQRASASAEDTIKRININCD